MKIFWFIPTHGDSRYLGTSKGARQLNHDYLKQVAVAADSLGYEGVLIPTGRSCEDPWVVAASLLPHCTNKLGLQVSEVHVGRMPAVSTGCIDLAPCARLAWPSAA